MNAPQHILLKGMALPTTPPATPPPLSEILSHDYLMWVADGYSFEIGHYPHVAYVTRVTEKSPNLGEGLVQDSAGNTQTVTFESVGSKAKASCTCTWGRRWCSHSVTVALRCCPDAEDPTKPWLDTDTLFERFLEKATRAELVEMPNELRDSLGQDDQYLILTAAHSVGVTGGDGRDHAGGGAKPRRLVWSLPCGGCRILNRNCGCLGLQQILRGLEEPPSILIGTGPRRSGRVPATSG